MNETLATEILKELKAASKRWFIAFCIMVGLELATIGGFFWYLSLPVEVETVEMDTEGNGNANYLENSTVEGGIHNGEGQSNQDAQENNR